VFALCPVNLHLMLIRSLRYCSIMNMMSESLFVCLDQHDTSWGRNMAEAVGSPFRGSDGVPSIQIHERTVSYAFEVPQETRHPGRRLQSSPPSWESARARAVTPLGRLRRSALHKPWRAREYGQSSPPCAPPSVGTTLHDSAGLWIPWARARPPSALSAQPPPAHAAHAAHSLAAAAAPACPSPFIPPLGWGGL
jgi:hypothetical protein